MFSNGFTYAFRCLFSVLQQGFRNHTLSNTTAPPGLNICTEHVNCKKQTPTEGGELVQNFSSDPSIRVALYDVKQHKRQMEDLFIYSYNHHTIPIINFGVLIYLSPVFYHSRVY